MISTVWWYNELTEYHSARTNLMNDRVFISLSALFATSQPLNFLQILPKIIDIKKKYVSICDLIFLATEVLLRKK